MPNPFARIAYQTIGESNCLKNIVPASRATKRRSVEYRLVGFVYVRGFTLRGLLPNKTPTGRVPVGSFTNRDCYRIF